MVKYPTHKLSKKKYPTHKKKKNIRFLIKFKYFWKCVALINVTIYLNSIEKPNVPNLKNQVSLSQSLEVKFSKNNKKVKMQIFE